MLNSLLKKSAGIGKQAEDNMYEDMINRVVDQVYDDYRNDKEDLSLVQGEHVDIRGNFLDHIPKYKAFLTAMSQMYSQVCNGGFEQWLDNGYGQRGGPMIQDFLINIPDAGPVLQEIDRILEQVERITHGEWKSMAERESQNERRKERDRFERDEEYYDPDDEDEEEDNPEDPFGAQDDAIYAINADELFKELAHAAEMMAEEKDFDQTSRLGKWISSLKARKVKKTSDLNTKATPRESFNNKEGNDMAKPTSLRERLAALKAKKAGAEKVAVQANQAEIAKEARVKVASAWTIAKTMLPSAPAAVQQKFAEALLPLQTKMLTAAVRQTAVNSHWTKIAVAIDEKLPLNKLVEEPALLAKLQKEVERETKGDPKNASVKTADYENPDEAQKAEEGAEKSTLASKIEDAKGENDSLKDDIKKIDGEELDVDNILGDDGAMEDKKGSLANENDFMFEAGEDDFEIDIQEPDELEIHSPEGNELHGPSDTQSLEQALNEMDKVEISDAADYFQTAGEEADSIGELFQTASDADVEPGEMVGFFENDESDTQDVEEDHSDLIGELMKGIGQEEFDTERDTEPKFEEPKAAKAAKEKDKKKARPVRSLGHPTLESAEQKMLASLVFPDDEL
jgi:hypothetical protein